PKRIIHTAGTKADIVPGTNKAVLTLGDGTQVVLESAGNGNIAIQGNSQIVKTDSSLSYNENGQAGIKQEIQFNVLTTPKGGIYKLILPDGTRVWLNAASSLRYPIAFSGSSRQVRLSGEGYFEIAHNASQPFLVQVEGMEIKDIGTTFDIKSYKDEDMIRATVLQGSIRVSKGNSSKILRPGEEAQVDGEKIEVVPADTEEAIGWKQGQFVFHKTPMGMVMRELERWYDIKVENKDGNHNHLNATIDRNVPLSKVLHYLEGSIELNFLPAERKLIVLK
ncbi:MAG: FecR family protein, partial [Flavisolibacter sp.]